MTSFTASPWNYRATLGKCAQILLANLWQSCTLQCNWEWLSDELRLLPQFSPLISARISVDFYRFTNLLTFGAQISEPFIVYKEPYKNWIGGDKVHSLIHAAANLASFLQGKHPQSLCSHALHRGQWEKGCKAHRRVYNPLLSHWDTQSSNGLFYKDFFSSVIIGEQNLKANVHKEFRFTSS